MSAEPCQVFPWCEEPDGHEGLAHTRLAFSVVSRAESLHATLVMSAKGSRQFVGLSVMDAWTGDSVNDRIEIAPDMAEALGALLLTFSADDTARLGEALMRAGVALGGAR